MILYSFHNGIPWQKGFKKGLHEHLASQGKDLTISEEDLDAVRFPEQTNQKYFTAFLSAKYQNTSFDLIVTDSPPASDLIHDHPSLFKNTPHLFVNPSQKVNEQITKNKKNTILAISSDIPQALDQLQSIFKPKEIVIVGETKSNISKHIVNEIVHYHNTMEHPIHIQYLLDLPTEVLLKKLSQLPKGSIIFYSLIFQDGSGKKYIPFEMAKLIAKNASVPVFSHWDTLLGSGIAGGYILSSQEVGKLTAQNIIKLLNNQEVKNDIQFSQAFKYIFDWKILKRFGLSLKDLPKQSIILNKPQGIWEKYYWQLIGGAILLLSIIIASFFWIISLKHQVQARTKQLDKQKQLAEKLAETDRLTDLPNRHAMEIFIHEEMLLHNRNRQPLCLMMMDLDHFKQVNDSYGHHTGDQVLKRFADTLEVLVRKTDYFSRWGGEEFIILLPNTSLSEALDLAERMRLAIAHIQDTELPSFTMSIGVAAYQTNQSFEQWYEQADQLLYQAKAKGRNRVCPDK